MRTHLLFAPTLVAAALFSGPLVAEPFKSVFPDFFEHVEADFQTELEDLDLKTGIIPLAGVAELDVDQNYYFLDTKDARYILETVWGNPEDTSVLGMVFPRDYTPFDDASWGLIFNYDPLGYVSDEDAENYDFEELLEGMQADTRESNEWRINNGYDAVALLGWAEPPHYDSVERKLYWAKSLRFGASDTNTLNYDIRALGRKGVLIASFIANENQLEEVKAAAPDVLNMISFTEGNRYTDFIPGVDTVAAVGIGGLIAGKAVAKTGFLILALAFLKKGAFLLLIPFFWLKNKLFGRRNDS